MDLRVLREKVLSDCPPHMAFWTCNGAVCRNIYELINNIKGQSYDVFMYHVNVDNRKNDYAQWIKDVLCDIELWKRLQDIMDKDLYVDIIEQRVKELENA